jgi:hypothetical protein
MLDGQMAPSRAAPALVVHEGALAIVLSQISRATSTGTWREPSARKHDAESGSNRAAPARALSQDKSARRPPVGGS